MDESKTERQINSYHTKRIKKSVIPNNPEQSPLFKRVTLGKEDDKFMPPQGKEDPLTKKQLKILETGYGKRGQNRNLKGTDLSKQN